MVTARGQVGVEGCPARACLDPAAVEALELVTILDLLRGHIAQARILKFEPVSARLDGQLAVQATNLVIDQNLFNFDRRGHTVFRRVCGINEADPIEGSEPQASVRQFPGRRVAASAALADVHAVCRAISVHCHGMGRAGRIRVQRGDRDPEDAGLGTEPQPAGGVFEHAIDRARQPLGAGGEGSDFRFFAEAVQPAAVGSQPERPLGVLVNRRDRVVGESLLHCGVGERVVLQPA